MFRWNESCAEPGTGRETSPLDRERDDDRSNEHRERELVHYKSARSSLAKVSPTGPDAPSPINRTRTNSVENFPFPTPWITSVRVHALPFRGQASPIATYGPHGSLIVQREKNRSNRSNWSRGDQTIAKSFADQSTKQSNYSREFSTGVIGRIVRGDDRGPLRGRNVARGPERAQDARCCSGSSARLDSRGRGEETVPIKGGS